jgi:hypothetical protein
MIGLLLKLLGLKKRKPKFTEAECTHHYEAKMAALQRVLGPMHNMVGHAVIPFYMGGTVDMYYFPNAIDGTAFVTMELIAPDGTGPKPGRIGTYELIGFTRHAIDLDSDGPFKQIQHHLCNILTAVSLYSFMAELNPEETCDLPGEEDEEGSCLLLDEWRNPEAPFEIDGRQHGLLLCMEIFKSESEFAREHGTGELIAKLKDKGFYPYSDLDREPVV